MVPSSGISKPAIMRSVVVLPDPEGPSMVKNSPAGMSRSTESTATTSPNRLVRPLTLMSGAPASGAKRLLQDGEPLVELVGRDVERREQPDDVPVEPAGEKDEPALESGVDDGLGTIARPFRELERQHRAEPANLADHRVSGRDIVEARA